MGVSLQKVCQQVFSTFYMRFLPFLFQLLSILLTFKCLEFQSIMYLFIETFVSCIQIHFWKLYSKIQSENSCFNMFCKSKKLQFLILMYQKILRRTSNILFWHAFLSVICKVRGTMGSHSTMGYKKIKSILSCYCYLSD